MVRLSAAHGAFNELATLLAAELQRRGLEVKRARWFCGADQSDSRPARRGLSAVAAEGGPDALVVPVRELAAHLQARLARHGRLLGREMDVISCYSGRVPRDMGNPWPLLATRITPTLPERRHSCF